MTNLVITFCLAQCDPSPLKKPGYAPALTPLDTTRELCFLAQNSGSSFIAQQARLARKNLFRGLLSLNREM